MSKPVMLHVITNFAAAGGGEMMLSRLIQQTQHQYDHIVIAIMGISDIYQEALDICKESYALSWNGINSFAIVYKLRKLIKKLAPQTIQCWMYHANVFTSLSVLGMQQRPNIIWGIHHSLASLNEESVATKISLSLSKVLVKNIEGIIYCAYSSESQHKEYGIAHKNSYVIANGVFLDKFQPKAELHESLMIGFAGRYHTAKGYPYLFETIAKLKDQPIIFKIAGQGANRDNPEIKGYLEQYQLDQNKVQLLDQISDMPTFYQSIDAFLMTSITEGFPNVLVEAMASGLPCISTDVGDAKYIVQELGSIVAPRDSDALANAILKYMNLSTEEKQQLKQATRERVEANFGIENVSQQYVNVWIQGR